MSKTRVDPFTDPNSLLHRTHGASAQYCLQQLGLSPAGRVRQLEADVAMLKRELTQIRLPLGLEIRGSAPGSHNGNHVDFHPQTRRIILHVTGSASINQTSVNVIRIHVGA